MKRLLIIALLLFTASVNAQDVDKSVAQALGLVPSSSESAFKRIPLTMNSSTELVFPVAGTLRLKPQLQEKLDIINANNRLIITPKVPLSGEQTVVFVLSDTQQSVLLKLFMAPSGQHIPVIRIGEHRVSARPDGRPTSSRPTPKIHVPGPINSSGSYIDEFALMASFAARSAYSPDRLLTPPKGLREYEVSVDSHKLNNLFRENSLRPDVLSSWEYKSWFVTVIQVTNMSRSNVHLSPELIRGRFLAKSFHRDFVGSTKTNKYTALYLISDVPFNKVLEDL